MADEKVNFELVSPERLLVSEQFDMVVVPGTEGDFGVLPGHSPVISTVRPGIIDIHDGGNIAHRVFVGGGFAEVTPERCTVLAEDAVMVDEIDRADVERRIQAVELDVRDAESDAERAKAEGRLAVLQAMRDAAA
jgi:F-type H+-transporting ATPase subunit epsilon